MINWYFGWSLIFSAFLTGAIIGLYFHRESFLGGYSSFSRRILRLGHIAQAALGMMNVVYALSAQASTQHQADPIAAWGFIIGGITMPGVCFLSAWKPRFRHLFFIPVVSLMVAVIQTLRMGP
ncbi:hypothetical protein SH668x_000953 [Planctomicrobium sp. SH668]|uniref:hypothetical protein n=1 Tax=Planctomicrobium sp. SH668 TaxID=3448126 RepID=UPI003F5B708F